MGFNCPAGSDSPIECNPGTFTDYQGASVCSPCVEGYYCPIRSTGYVDKPCPVGHYCPQGTNHSLEYPCQPGTFNPNENGVSSDNCLLCPAGQFCSQYALSSSEGNCSEGFYCTLGSPTATPVDLPQGSNCPAGFTAQKVHKEMYLIF